jgi:dipeptidyl aminopeptidase/acylaminoacyl peptidase
MARRSVLSLIAVVAGAAISALLWSRAPRADDSTAPLSMETYLHARWPSRPAWSPDGRYVSFLWTDWVGQDLYVVPAAGGAPVALTQGKGFVGGSTWNSSGGFGAWSPDSQHLVYSLDGDLQLTKVPEATTTRLTETEESEDGARFSPDGTRLAFLRGGNVFVMLMKDRAITQLTREGRSGGLSWSPDGKWIAFSISEGSPRMTASPDYSGPLIVFLGGRASQRDVGLVSTAGGAVRLLEPSAANEGVVNWAPDGARLLIERTSIDVKDRTLLLCTASTASCQPVYTQRDEKYLASNDQIAAFSPDGQSILLTSDQDGWNHAYVMPAAGGVPRQVTKGAFEVSFPSWSRDGQRIFYSSSEAGPDQRQIYSVAASGGPPIRLTAEAATHTTLTVSARDEIAFIRTDPKRLPDVWALETSAGAKPRQLTESMTPDLKAYGWQTPQIVTFAGAGGTAIKAQLFVPRGLDRSRKYPAIVHVHQAAIYQEVFLGPGPHKDNVGWYGWHQRMADRGFVVLNVDFRGSYGYGRDFRTGNHLDVGVGDAQDVIQGVEYLKGVGYVDPNRLGVYGMSYGGHMVLTLLTKYPDVFKAGINIAGVYDFQIELGPWATRNPWMQARLGPPETNPEAYRQASAINFIDNLKAPVMTLQGTADTNVVFLQSIKLVDDLLARGKTFEFELYPGEVHFFGRRRSWVDAFGKMEAFLDRYLTAPPATPSTQ